MTNREKYNEAFIAGLSIGKDQLVESLEYNSIDEWDSIGHMGLIAELEECFSITIETDDIIEFSSYIKGFEILNKYGVSFDN